MLAVRWCLRLALSYRDVEELLAERDRGRPHHRLPLAEAARPYWHRVGDRWQVDET